MNFQFVPVSSQIADAVRATLVSPQYGHPATVEIAKGYGPCRACLRTFREGIEERILFTYNAFEGLLGVPLPGPVFIHMRECDRYEASEFPAELLALPLLLECYGADGSIRLTVEVDRTGPEEQIVSLFSDPSTKFINVRNAEAGCHVARICRDPAF